VSRTSNQDGRERLEASRSNRCAATLLQRDGGRREASSPVVGSKAVGDGGTEVRRVRGWVEAG